MPNPEGLRSVLYEPPTIHSKHCKTHGYNLGMSTIVLVHGAWQSVATWDILAPLLTKDGHIVVTPVLTGLGTSQSPLSRDVSLTQHVRDVTSELSKLKEPVILVGHSYAGMIVSGVAEQVPSMIHHLVFLDAFIPEDGQSVLDLLPAAVGHHFQTSHTKLAKDGVCQEERDSWICGV